MKKKLHKKNKILLLLCAVSALTWLRPRSQALAASQCPTDSSEHGSSLMEEAENQPSLYRKDRQTLPFTAEDQLSAIFYCTVRNSLYLAGFKFTFGSEQLEFGDLDTVQLTESNVECNTIIVDEWITSIQYYWSVDQGLLGFQMVGNGATEYRVKALGTGAFETSDIVALAGPPLGFSVLFSDADPNRANTPVSMSTVVNGCACDFSYFLGSQGPRDMNTDSVSGTADTQIVPNQSNFISQTYGQDCGQTIISISPEYNFLAVTTDDTSGQHSLKLESVKNEIGAYTVTALIAPADPFSLMTPIEYEFALYIHPCILQNVIVTPPQSVSFEIGEPDITLSYAHQQVPDCQYPTEVFFSTSLPTYMEHDIDLEQIVYPYTDDTTYASLYSGDMGVRVYIPIDYTYDEGRIENFKSPFTVEIIDPCPDSVILPFSILDESLRVFTGAIEQFIPTPQDQVSLNYGTDGTSFCGPRLYQFIVPALPGSSVVQFDETTNTIIMESSDMNEVGTHIVQATVILARYTSVRRSETFQLTIYPCKITSFESPEIDDQSYDVFMIPKVFTTPVFVQEPACDYDVIFTYEVLVPSSAAGTLPAWIDETSNDMLSIQTDDITNVGAYVIRVTASVPETIGVAFPNILTEVTTFNLLVGNGCIEDVISPAMPAIDALTQYAIDTDGTKQFELTFEQLQEGCPIEFDLLIVDQITSDERPISPEESTIITVDEDAASKIVRVSILASDYALDSSTIEMRVVLRSIYSEMPDEEIDISGSPQSAFATTVEGTEGSYLFKVIFIDPCWLSELIPGQFDFSERTYDLFQDQDLQFTAMSDLTMGTQCGGFTYTLEYISGPVSNSGFEEGADLGHYARDALSYVGMTSDMGWVGTHKFRLKCTNGNSSNTSMSARGENGLFYSVYSDTITLIISNPCSTSRVSQLVILNMNMPVGQTLMTTQMSGPSDSASLEYGNGYNMCGPLDYTLLDPGNNDVFYKQWLNLSVEELAGEADKIYINLISEPQGVTKSVLLRLKVSLENYSGAQAAYIPFQVTYRGCFFDQFTGSQIGRKTVQVGKPTRLIDYVFTQGDCIYDFEIVTSVVNSAGETIDDPDFISNVESDSQIAVHATQESHIGRYMILIEATLLNVLDSQAQISFILDVVERDIPVNVYEETELPEADVQLYVHKQRVKVGSNRTIEYQPMVKERNTYGYRRTLGLDLGLWKQYLQKFVTYDPDLNVITFESSRATEENLGTFDLRFYSTYYNSTYEWTEEFTFELIVFQDPVIRKDEKNRTEPQVPEEPDKNTTLGGFKDGQPIPTISHVTQSGQVTIVWDRTMLIPEDLDQIALKKISVLNSTGNSDFGKGVGLATRKLEASEDNFKQQLDALELRIAPKDGDFDDSREIVFHWDVVSFEKKEMQLQLTIENPATVSEGYQLDQLQITFYDQSLFRAAVSPQEGVRYGTRLTWDLHRMISQEDADTIDYLKVFYVITLVTLFISIPMMAIGDLLPTWVFVHSLQLIAHTPLLCSAMPGNVQYFMQDYLTVTRVREPDFTNPAAIQASTSQEGDEEEEDYEGAFNFRFQENGYAQLIGINLIAILYIAVVILVLWVLAELKDLAVRKSCRKQQRQNRWWARQHGPVMSNVAIRLVYVMLLEILICAFLTVSHPDLESEKAAGLQWIVSLLVIVATCAAIIGLVYLCYKKSPLSVDGFYTPKTWRKSFWEVRPVQGHYSEYAVDGKGSDDLENFNLYGTADKSILDKPNYAQSSQKAEVKMPAIKDIFDMEAPPTSRNLLDNEPENNRLRSSPKGLQNQFMNVIEENHQNITLRKPVLETNQRAAGLPEQNTGLIDDSLLGGSLVDYGNDLTIPQLSRGNDSILGGTMDKKMELLEGGEIELEKADGLDVFIDQGTDMSRDEETDRREKRDLYLRRLARKRLYLADEEAMAPARYGTIYLGLKKNTERDSAMVHVMAFVMRRVLYALLVVVFAQLMITSTIVFLLMSLTVLAIACHEHQWEHWLIDQQHIVNEMFLYVIAVMLFCFTGFSGQFNTSLGWTMIGLICAFIVYNAIVVLRFALRSIRVIAKTVYYRYIKKYLSPKQKQVSATNQKDSSESFDEELESAKKSNPQAVKEDKKLDLADGEAQTEDYEGLLSRFFAWLQGRRYSGADTNGFCGMFGGSTHEMSFGKKKESDEESVHSGGTFGGGVDTPTKQQFNPEKAVLAVSEENWRKQQFGAKDDIVIVSDDSRQGNQIALKTLDKNLLHHRGTQSSLPPEHSPVRDDIFNKSGQNELQDTERGLLSGHKNIPIRISKKDSIADNINNMSSTVIRELSKEDQKSSHYGSGKNQQASIKRKKRRGRGGSKNRLAPSRTADAHLDPKRQINLLEQSGLSNAIEANLNLSAAHRNSLQKDSESGAEYSASKPTFQSGKKVRPEMIAGDEGLDENQFSSSENTAQANAQGRIGLSRNTDSKLKGRKSSQKHGGTGGDQIVRSSKMFESENLRSSNTGGDAVRHFDEAAADGQSQVQDKNLESIRQISEENISSHALNSVRKKSRQELVKESLEQLSRNMDSESGDQDESNLFNSQDFTVNDVGDDIRDVIRKSSFTPTPVKRDDAKTSTIPPPAKEDGKTSTIPPPAKVDGKKSIKVDGKKPVKGDGKTSSTTPPAKGSRKKSIPPPAKRDGKTSSIPPPAKRNGKTSSIPPPAKGDGKISTKRNDGKKSAKGDGKTSTIPPPAKGDVENTSIPLQAKGDDEPSSIPPSAKGDEEPSSIPPSVLDDDEPSVEGDDELSSIPPSVKDDDEPSSIPPSVKGDDEPSSIPPSVKGDEEPSSIPPSVKGDNEPSSSPPSVKGDEEPSSIPPSVKDDDDSDKNSKLSEQDKTRSLKKKKSQKKQRGSKSVASRKSKAAAAKEEVGSRNPQKQTSLVAAYTSNNMESVKTDDVVSKRQLKEGTLSKTGRGLDQSKKLRKDRSQQKKSKWVNMTPSGAAQTASLHNSVVRDIDDSKLSNKMEKKSNRKKAAKSVFDEGQSFKSVSVPPRKKAVQTSKKRGDAKSINFDDGQSFQSVSVPRVPKKRMGLMAPTQATHDRNFARLNEVKEEKMPPMKYTNQGQQDIVPPHRRQTHEDGEDTRRNRSVSGSSQHSMSVQRLQQSSKAFGLNNKEASVRQNRFKQDGPSESYLEQGASSSSPRKDQSTNRSKTSMAKRRAVEGRNNSSLAPPTTHLFPGNRKNSTDGFKQSSNALRFKKTTAQPYKEKLNIIDKGEVAIDQNEGTEQTVAPFKSAQTDAEMDLNALLDKYGDNDLLSIHEMPKESTIFDLQQAIDSAIGGDKSQILDGDDLVYQDQPQMKVEIKTGGKKTGAGSILSDWDEITLTSGHNNQNYFKKPSKKVTSRKADKDDLFTQLRKRYGIKNGDNGKSSGVDSSRVSSQSKKKNFITPGFNPEGSSNVSKDKSYLAQDVEPIQEIASDQLLHKSPTDYDLGIQDPVLDALQESIIQVGKNDSYMTMNNNNVNKSQISAISKRSASSIIGGPTDMMVPMSLEGSVLQFTGAGNHGKCKSRKPLMNRNASGTDFAMYADAFGFGPGRPAKHHHQSSARRGVKRWQSNAAVAGSNNDLYDIAEFYDNTYLGCATGTKVSPNRNSPPKTEIKATLEKFLNEMPQSENGNLSPTSAIKANHINFVLGGDGNQAQGGHQGMQNRLSAIKKSKLFQTVMDTHKDFNNSQLNAGNMDNSFTKSIVRNTPYQSRRPQDDQMASYNKRVSSTGLRLQQPQKSCVNVLPDATSEGNRKDMLNHLFFPGSRLSQNMSRMGSGSVRSVSCGSQETVSISNRVNVGLNTQYKKGSHTSRLGANKAAGASIIGGGLSLSTKGGCKGKRFCSVSDLSSQGY